MIIHIYMQIILKTKGMINKYVLYFWLLTILSVPLNYTKFEMQRPLETWRFGKTWYFAACEMMTETNIVVLKFSPSKTHKPL